MILPLVAKALSRSPRPSSSFITHIPPTLSVPPHIRLPMSFFFSSSSSSSPASPATLPGFLRRESPVASTESQYRLFSQLNQLERQRLQVAYVADSPFSVLTAVHPSNRKLNRYTDIVPYKHSQVVVGPASTFINANRLTAPPGLRSSLPPNWRGYIATQAPLPNTQPHFWRMVFEQNVHVIVCLTAVSPNRASRSQKAEQYWPPAGETDFLDQSDLCVRNVDSVDSEDQVAYRHFEIWNPLDTEDGARRHNVLLVHYQGWPDHGVPSKTTDLRDILYRIRAWKADQQQTSGTTDFGPMVVHCSAGCGRTGTFCVVDTVLSVLEYTRYPHMAAPSPSGHTMPVSSQQGTGDAVYDWRSDRDIIFESLTSFREERMLMVQTAAQYSFCYTVARDLCR